jgi:hypothetical protein
MTSGFRIPSTGLVLALVIASTTAQVSTRVAAVSPDEATAGTTLTLVVELQQAPTIDGLMLLYRLFGESQYRRIDMDITGNRASAVIPGTAVSPPFLEYYLVVRDRSGTLEVYPFSDSPNPLTSPPQNTKRIQVREVSPEGAQIVFLSPDPMSILSEEEVLISVSLLRADSLIAREATQLMLDGINVTSKALFTGDLIIFNPVNANIALTPGPHVVTVLLFDRKGGMHGSSSVTFTIQGETLALYSEPRADAFRYDASLQIESRHEDTGESGEWYNRTGVNFRGVTGDFRVRSNLFVTSDEKSYRQPQNRYFVGAELPWLRVGLGDAYPEFPDLILSGKRVRGVTSSLRLGTFTVDVAYGSVTRAIDGAELQRFPLDSLLLQQTQDPRAAYAQIDAQTWGKYSYGTYERTLFAVHPSVGSGETWQLGFTWLNGKDDLGSIRYGIRPQENIVLGTDFFARLDNGRTEIAWQVALSAFNSDISSGTFTEAYIDSVYPNDRDAIKTARNILQSLITFNENLRPLSFKKLATAAGQASLGLNYFDNALKFTYLFRGNDFTSFGQTYLRTDIQGINIIDRIHLLRNQVFATLGYERLQDNTASTRSASTTYTTLNAALSLYLIADFPGITVGYSRYDNGNGLPRDSLASVNDATNRVYVQSAYGFEFGARHTAFLSLSSSIRQDNTVRGQTIKNHVASFGLASHYTIPLQTEVSASINLNTLPVTATNSSHSFNYTALSLHAKYDILQEVLAVMATIGPTLGDFSRTVLDTGIEWHITPPMSFILQASYFKNSGHTDENFVSLRYRYDI